MSALFFALRKRLFQGIPRHVAILQSVSGR